MLELGALKDASCIRGRDAGIATSTCLSAPLLTPFCRFPRPLPRPPSPGSCPPLHTPLLSAVKFLLWLLIGRYGANQRLTVTCGGCRINSPQVFEVYKPGVNSYVTSDSGIGANGIGKVLQARVGDGSAYSKS